MSQHDRPASDDEETPCLLCGLPLDKLEDSYLLLRGAYMESVDLGGLVFKLDPDTSLQVLQLADGSLALHAPQYTRGPTRSTHTECMHRLAYDVGVPFIDPEDEEMMQDDIPPEFR